MTADRRAWARSGTSVLVVGMMAMVLAGCGTWRHAGPEAVRADDPSPSSTATTDPAESGPDAALRRLYDVVDQLDGHPTAPISRLDAVATGPARDELASAIRHRRTADRPGVVPATQISQIVVRPSVRAPDTVSAVVQFCTNRQIESESLPSRQELQPTTITFRYQSGRWRAHAFGFDVPDCGCSQPVQCG